MSLQPPTLHLHDEADGTLVARFDQPGRSVNTISPAVLDELDALLAAIERGDRRPRGLVFASAKPDSFIAGADLHAMREMHGDEIDRFLEHGQMLAERIARLAVPTVAAINGHCLGGGLELALACSARVAVDDGGIRIGLPESKLGLIPAWGGTTRVTERLGPVQALSMMLPGRTFSPRKALAAGLIDEVVRPEALDHAARRLLARPPAAAQPPRAVRAAMAVAALRRRLFNRARRQTQARTHGHYPAAGKLIDVAQTVVEQGHDAGLKAERQAERELVETDACRNLMRLFFLRQQAKRVAGEAASGAPRPVQRAAVIGGGTMGAGIVHALIVAGVSVRLIEVSPPAASAALRRVQSLLDDDRRSRRLSPLQVRQAMQRLSPSTEWTGLALADLAIEAVLEKPALKQEVFEKLGRLTRRDAVLATNTSALDIPALASAAGRPEHVIGLHFFNPVAKMPLVEVVRTAESGGDAIATGVGTAQRLEKTPLVVRHGPAFLVNRLLLPALAEALAMVAEGVDPRALDRAMRNWGMPMGPCELLDHVGLDVTLDILDALQPRLGDRIAVPPGLAFAVEQGWLGRKSGRGFYEHQSRRLRIPGRVAQPRVNEALLRRLRQDRQRGEPWELDDEAMQRRIVLPMINEAGRTLLEGITDEAEMIDLATVLGLGLAPFRGGLVQHAEAVGLPLIVQQLDELAARHGRHLDPLPELRRLAEQGRPMQALVDLRSPATGPARRTAA